MTTDKGIFGKDSCGLCSGMGFLGEGITMRRCGRCGGVGKNRQARARDYYTWEKHRIKEMQRKARELAIFQGLMDGKDN